MEKNTKIILAIAIVGVMYVGNIGGFATFINKYLTTPGPFPPTTTTATATGPYVPWGPLAISFTLKAQNGTALLSYPVNFYHYEGGQWVADASATSNAATGLVTTAAVYYEDQEIYVNVPRRATAATSLCADWWQKVKVKRWIGDRIAGTVLQVETEAMYDREKETGQMTIHTAPYTAARLDQFMYTDNNTVVSQNAGFLALSTKIRQAQANQKFKLSLCVITNTWMAFGGKFDIPQTNQGALARKLTSMLAIELNYTLASFDTTQSYSGASMTWQTASATNGTCKRYVIEVPRIQTRNTFPTYFDVTLAFDFTTVAVGTGICFNTFWTDQQTIDDAKNGVIYAGVGANIGFSRNDRHVWHLHIVA